MGLTNNSPSVASRRVGGVRHRPEVDIESIRELLHGYASARSILKELIQNAEDAGASRMDVLYLPGEETFPHSLLRGPSLLVVNDGGFAEEHRDAISQISLGTKGTEDRAIGRFGKGLKSVFAWCEAFFIIARTDPKLGWTDASISDFFNPWFGWRHSDWDDEFRDSHGDIFVSKVEQHLGTIYPAEKPWLALWFPLRCEAQANSANAADEWIFQLLSGNDPEFYQALCSEFRSLVPSLVSLRSLQHIVIADRTANPYDSLVLNFPLQSQRIPSPDTTPGSLTPVTGKVNLRTGDGRDTPYQYCGLAGRLLDEEVTHLKASRDWPKVVQRTRGQDSAARPVKGEPHFSTLITWRSISDDELSGSLNIRWCVFFPVGKQPSDDRLLLKLTDIRRHITINLHGFFFLDSERLRIDGLDERFNANGTSATKIYLEWNRIVASEGTLARLPEALARFAKLESLDDMQCHEIVGAIRSTWLWQAFDKEICQIQTWRPRWRSGNEQWELISAEAPVLVIPSTDQAKDVLERISCLGSLSEELTLVAGDEEVGLPGLQFAEPSRWTEAQVLQLLDNVQLDPGDDAAPTWINRFLGYLHAHGDLSSAIRERASELPLLVVQDARKKTRARISGREWLTLVEGHKLFRADGGSTKWTSLLCEVLPTWSCFLATELPRWFDDSGPPICNGTTAAQVVLEATEFGNFVDRKQLVEALTPEIHFGQTVARAIRLLMHANPSYARDTEKSLFLPSTQQEQQIWARILEQILARNGGADSWRLLHVQWALVLSPQLQHELNVSTIDAKGLWTELVSCGSGVDALEFPIEQWSTDDVCTIFAGLFQAGGPSQQDETVSLLRKLRLHSLRGQPNQRVSIADEEGSLSNLFILNTQDFETDLPPGLEALWQAFLSETHIVDEISSDALASAVQRQMFRRTDAEGTVYVAELDWNYVVRRCLDAPLPAERAPLIIEALSRGDQSARGLGQRLKKTPWLPLALGGSIAPDSVIYIEGLEDDLHRLLDPKRDGLAALKALQESISGHAGFATLRNYLPRIEQALEMLALWLDEKKEWRLGLTKQCNLSELEPILSQLKEFEDAPAAAFLLKLRDVRVRGYNEGIDALISEHLLPAVLRPFDYSQGGVDKVEAILRRLEGKQNRSAFDAYLAQACKDGKVEDILPKISLVNQRGQWLPARELIWPSVNLDPKTQLCAEQAGILAPLHNAQERLQTQSLDGAGQPDWVFRGFQLPREPDFNAEADKLREYLQPFRTGNVGETLPAALIAVLGGHPRVLSLLQELLHAGIGLEPEDFVALLLGDRADALYPSMQSARFLVDIVRGDSTTARTITGEEITVEFTKDIESLIVGDPSDLWFTHYYRSQMDTACHRLRLRWIDDSEMLQDAIAVFASTIQTIVLKVHCNGVSSSCPSNIREVLSDIADAGQTDLKRSRSYLLDMAEARLRELGVKDVPQLNSVLQKFTEARQARVDAELLANNAPAKAKQRSADAERLSDFAKRELVALLEADQENATQRGLVDAVRRKMSDYQYGLDSLAFELFQNADDAVAELEEMQNSEDPQARRFILRLDNEQKAVEIVHWGRPINRYEYPGFYEGLKRGYDQDLQKMLTLNFTDKGVNPGNHPGFVTGRFGLGFKSVFFSAQQPEVISGRLAFCIRGGFFPVPLFHSVAEDMRASAASFGPKGLTPTAIRLKWAHHLKHSDITNTVEHFVEIAPILPIFARSIRTVTVTKDNTPTTWTTRETNLTESGRLSYVQVGSRTFFCFRCPVGSDEHPATVLFHVDRSGISPLPAQWTGLWITTPTAERSELTFALNAPFKPDAGRQRLAVNNHENRAIAKEVAQVWAGTLIDLFDQTTIAWDRFSNVLNLHAEATPESWWKQLWRETTRSSPVTHWKSIQNGGQTLSWIAWGQPDGAMRRLFQQRAAIPTDLPGEYAKLIKQQDVKFSIAGLLAETANECFLQVSHWLSTRTAFPPGLTVHSTITAYLLQAEFPITVESVTLEGVLRATVSPECQADHSAADCVGKLFIHCKSLFEPNSTYASEVQRLLGWMKGITFIAHDGGYHQGNELVCSRAVAGVIEEDEALRAAFAPESVVLSAGYSDAGLSFFVKARGQLGAGAPMLANWAHDASADRLPSVFKYLVNGELGQQLADQLKRSWLDTKRQTSAWQGLSQEDKDEVERKFLRGYHWQFPPVIEASPPEPEVKQEMDAETAFALISEWWQRENKQWVARYEAKTYPSGFPGALPWPGDDKWDSIEQPSAQTCWLLLFVHAALVPLGFNIIGRDQGFSQFLVSKKWLDVFARVPDQPEALLAALDEYLGTYVQNTEYHFQMRQFVAFYAVAKNLESLLLSLKEMERSDVVQNLRVALSPRANPALTGTGIDAPPLTGMLGIGSCQLLRELYRLGRLSNPMGHRFAFTPIRKVRRICVQLFGIPEGPSSIESSEIIFDALNELGGRLGLDPSFTHCFDLPLQFLAQDDNLRTRVLKKAFDVIIDEDLDAAP